MRVGWILLLAIAGVLYLYNPGFRAFEAYLQSQISEQLHRELGSSPVGRAFAERSAALSLALTYKGIHLDNYYLWSIYTVDPDGPDGEQDYWRFLGIGGRFFMITQPLR
jgi:hypothetical protein